MNPLVHDVRAAFDKISSDAQSITIDRTGVPLPEGGHFQGIQRLSGTRRQLVITSSSSVQAYFLVCDMARDGRSGRARPPVLMPQPPLTHAGGCQIVDRYLVAGLELNEPAGSSSQIQAWDLRQTPPVQTGLVIDRQGPHDVATAGATGITSFGRGYVLAVATVDARTVDFYVSEGDPFTGSRFVFKQTWTVADADKTGWIDPNFGSYQNINLITQADGKLFMVAFDRSALVDWMDLFSIDLAGPAPAAFRKLAKKHMFCTDGCAFDAGSGIFVRSSAGFEVYAVAGKSGDHGTGTTINANRFGAG